MSHSTNLITLTDFVKNESNKLKAETADYINYSEFSRALSGEFPSVLKELFLIEEKKGNKPYQIKTQYPDLLFAMLHSWRNMPFLDKGRASNTFECNTKFYRECIHLISLNGWNTNSVLQYYLFERLFRLHTKVALFNSEQQCKEKKHSVSPGFLADYFFPSPFGLLPWCALSYLLYQKWRDTEENLEIEERQTRTLCYLARLSHHFYYILGLIRQIMQERKLQSPEEITTFFFPEGKDEEDKFANMVRPKDYLVLANQGKSQTIRKYNEKWRDFVPVKPVTKIESHVRTEKIAYISRSSDYLHALEAMGREDWSTRDTKAYKSHIDQLVLLKMQERI
jgi:hypothetical protein